MQNFECALPSIDLLKLNEEGAWTAFSALFWERLRRYFHSLGVERHESEDLSQEVLGTVFKRIGAVRDPERLDGWVLAIARNLLRSRRRRRRAEPEEMTEDGGLALIAADPPTDQGDDLRRLVRAELRTLPPSTRRLLEVRVLEGRSPGEAWLILGLTPEQQRRRLYVALKELRRRLGERRCATACFG